MPKRRHDFPGLAGALLMVLQVYCSGSVACLPIAPPDAEEPAAGASSQPADDLEVRLPLKLIRHENGLCYVAHIPLIRPNERDDGQTSVRLFEDGVELTGPGTRHSEIRDKGHGRYSQWGSALFFSSIDGTDPTTNGRRYIIAFQKSNLTEPLDLGFDRIADIPTPAIQSGIGNEYIYTLPLVISAWPSDLERLNGSRLIILEDGAPLGPAHTRIPLIQTVGAGRYQHHGDSISFSTSDNSDPRVNGRVYSIALASPTSNHFVDPFVGAMPPLREALPAPVIAWPSEGEVIDDAQPTFRVTNADPSLLYYWELDVVPTFDSSNLHRRPGTRETREGGNPVQVLDREPSFAPEFTPPYRLGALMPISKNRAAWVYTAIMAARLGYGLPPGKDELHEVYSYVANQLYPIGESAEIHEPEETWQSDRGFCISVNYLASQILADLGYHTRRVCVDAPSPKGPEAPPLSSHSSLEVFCNGRWSIFDPWLGFYLDGVSYQSLAESPDRHQYYALMYYSPGATTVDELVPIYLSDYARIRKYDQFDNWYAGYSSPAEERQIYSGEPATIPDPDWRNLWSWKQLRLYVRVRSAALSPEVVFASLHPRQEARNFNPDHVDVSPWTMVSFTIDLAKAYGFEVPPEESPEAEPAE